jgi:uncharacterized membrane protein YeaQ/YmgE (transglycosylase-associated protein family)
MSLLFWVMEGVLAGWLMGKIMRSEGRDRLMNIIMGVGGAVAGALIITATSIVHGKMIYANLAAIAGGMLLAFLSRYVGGSREYGRTN